MPSIRSHHLVDATKAATFAAVVTLSIMLPAAQAAPAASDNPATIIYRCVMPDGAISYADRSCKGAATVTRWRAPVIAKGITRSEFQTMETAPATDRKDPFLNCRELGGEFSPAAKLCRLPAGVEMK